MKLILCLDDRLGMTFNGRRQSRDSAVLQDIADMAAGSKIAMHEKSAKLFSALPVNICPIGSEAEYCFIEFEQPAAILKNADELIIYRWNRHYAADMHCEIDFNKWKLTALSEFAGSSHEKITKEVFNRG